jgi:hypothetical protein
VVIGLAVVDKKPGNSDEIQCRFKRDVWNKKRTCAVYTHIYYTGTYIKLVKYAVWMKFTDYLRSYSAAVLPEILLKEMINKGDLVSVISGLTCSQLVMVWLRTWCEEIKPNLLMSSGHAHTRSRSS